MSLGSIVIRLSADSAEFKSGLNEVRGQLAEFNVFTLAKFGTVIGAAANLGAGIAQGIADGLRSIPQALNEQIGALDQIQNFSERIGIASGDVQVLATAALLADTNLEGLQRGFKEFNSELVKAATGNKEASTTFRSLGIDAQKALSDPLRAFEQFTAALAEVDNRAVRAEVGSRALGKAYLELAPLIDKGGAALSDARAELERFGALASTELVQSAAEFKDNMDRLALAGNALKNSILEGVLPASNAIIKAWFDLQKEGSALARVVRDLFTAQTLVSVFEAVAKAAAALWDVLAFGAGVVKVIGNTIFVAASLIYNAGGVIIDTADAISKALILDFEGARGALGRINEKFVESGNLLGALGRLTRDVFAPDDNAFRQVDRFFANVRQNLSAVGATTSRGSRDAGVLNVLREQPGAAAQKKDDPFASTLEGLQKDAAKLQFQIQTFEQFRGTTDASKIALIEFELQLGKLSDEARREQGLAPLTNSQREALRGLALGVAELGRAFEQTKAFSQIDDRIAAIDAETEGLRKTNVERQVAVELDKLIRQGVSLQDPALRQRETALRQSITQLVQERENLASAAFAQAERDTAEAFDLETRALTLTVEETRKLTEARRIDLAVRNATRDASGRQVVTDQTLQIVQQSADEAKRITEASIDRRRLLERDAATGIQQFLRDYVEQSTNAAADVQQVLGSVFGGLQRELENVLATGRVNARSIVDILNAEFRRLIARDILADIAKRLRELTSELQAFGSAAGGSGSSGLLGQLFGVAINALAGGGGYQQSFVDAAGGGVQTGTVPIDNTPIEVRQLPASVRTQVGNDGGQIVMANTYNIDSRTDAAQVRQIAQQEAQRAVVEFRAEIARNGPARASMGR